MRNLADRKRLKYRNFFSSETIQIGVLNTVVFEQIAKTIYQ